MKVFEVDISFDETPYGIVKRIRVIEEWLSSFGRPLDLLDFGCGTGELVTFPLARAGHRVLGVDFHEPSIERARQSFQQSGLEFRTSTVADLMSIDRSFDAIICSEVIEHLEDPKELLRKFHRLLGDNGLLVITTPNGYGAYEILCKLERAMLRLGIQQVVRRIAKPQNRPCESEIGFLNRESRHIQFFRLRTLEEVFRDCQFKIIDRRPRTLLCGPYIDLLFRWMPFQRSLVRLNARITNLLPLSLAADWMFLLRKT